MKLYTTPPSILTLVTRSGFEPSPVDTNMSAGIVVPLTLKAGRSENTSVSSVTKLFTVDAICRYTLSWRQVNHPLVRATLLMFVIRARAAYNEEYHQVYNSIFNPSYN